MLESLTVITSSMPSKIVALLNLPDVVGPLVESPLIFIFVNNPSFLNPLESAV